MKKHYWKVRMFNGGYKIVFDTENNVRNHYEYDDYIICFPMPPTKVHFEPQLIG